LGIGARYRNGGTGNVIDVHTLLQGHLRDSSLGAEEGA